jgi:hypothetical protein
MTFRPVFTLRLNTGEPVQAVAQSVSKALGVELKVTRYAPGRAEVYSGETLGLLLELVAWPPWPREGSFTYQLQGVPSDVIYTDQDQKVDVSQHVMDILGRREAGPWYIPSLEQVLEELDLGEQIDSDA